MPRSLEPGDLVERYRVESILGQGGVAKVYRVRHTTLGTVHALKLLTVDHPVLRKRLLAEGKAQAQLSHPNVVPVRDVIEVDDCPALLMDFVAGRSLNEVLKSGPLTPSTAVALFRQVAQGVAYAHGEGLIHRDLKPANVLLDDTVDPPVPRVADFGLVRVLDVEEGDTRHTRAGMAMGTPGYMAPEQVRDAQIADERTDIFALGAMLYTMVVGRPPFSGDDHFDIMTATANGDYPAVEVAAGGPIPPNVVRVIEGALQVQIDDRFASVDALLQALGGVSADPSESMQLPPHSSVDVDDPFLEPKTADWPAPSITGEVMEAGAPQPAAVTALAGQEDTLSTSVSGLVVDISGRGHVVEVAVTLDPDGAGVQHAPEIARDAQVAAQLAVAVALGPQASEFGVTWAIRGNTEPVHGTSLGLPLAVAIRCAHQGLSIPSGWAFTGGLDLDGRLAPVSGIPAKVRAAGTAGLRHVAVPVEGLGTLDAPAGVEVLPTRSFDRLMERLHPTVAPRAVRPWRRRMLVLLLPVLAAFTGLTNRFEPLIHDPLLRAIHGPLPADNTAILAFEPQRDARELRAQHPAVIDGLVAAGARTIFFDVTMISQTPHDAEIGAAIQRARDAGVAVVMPVVMEAGKVLLPEAEAIRSAAWFGPVVAQADTTLWHVRRAPVRIRTVKHGDYWHGAVQAARGHLSLTEEPRVSDGTLIVGPTRNPVWADVIYLHPAQPSPILDYDDPQTWAGARGRTVLIGEMGGVDDIHRTDAETVYGVQIEAALVETLLQQAAPRVASPEINTLVALLIGLLTAGLGLALPRRRWMFSLLMPLAGVTVVVVLIVAGVLVSTLPMLMAAGVGLWVGRTRVVTSGQTRP